MEALFLDSLNTNIVLVWIIAAILLVRIVLKKVSKQLCCLLWAIVGLKCLIPISFESIFSFIPSAEFFNLSDIYSHSFKINSGITIVDTFINNILGSRYYEGVTVPTGTMLTTVRVLSIIWIVGMLAFLLGSIISIFSLKKKLCTSIKYEKNIWQSDMITSPFVFGFIRPKIYIPFKVKNNDLQYIVLHEKEHIRHGDQFWKLLFYFIVFINWYNPLIWIAYKKFADDLETACDERATNCMSISERKQYANTLLGYTVNKTLVLGDQLYFGRENIKERIKNIIEYKEPSKIVVFISFVLLIIISIGLLTNPKSSNQNLLDLLQMIF